MEQFKWSPGRLRKNIDELAQIGADPNGGITRLSFSPEYDKAASLFAAKLRIAGLQVYTDPLGNVIGTRPGRSQKSAVMTGSHLDTVVQGGLYDGALGALAALEYVTALQENEILLECGLKVVGFAAEEGGVFGGTFGSRAMMGLIDYDDSDLETKLSAAGISLQDLQNARMDTDIICGFLELHIEQGDFLTTNGIPVGIVEGIVGITRLEITIIGESNHSGTTTMDARRDSVEAFAHLVILANSIIRETPGMVGTFGVVKVHPNMANIVPGKVVTILELRHMERNIIEEVILQLKDAAQKIATAEIIFRTAVDKGSCQCDPIVRNSIERACEKTGADYIHMASGAGHDANAVANRIPTGMIFVPSLLGKSHCPQEDTAWEDIVTGCQVYFETLREMDRRFAKGE